MSLPRIHRLAAVTAFVLAASAIAVPAPAWAGGSTIYVDFNQAPSTLHYRAAAGQQNNVTLTMIGGEFVVSDAAGIDPGANCRRIGADNTRVACAWAFAADFDLGDLGDRFDSTVYGTAQPTPRVLGGEGDDWMYGSEGADNFDGQRGADRLYGNGGDDQLWSCGPDTPRGCAYDGENHVLGGPGNDTLRAGGGGTTWVYLYGDLGNDRLEGGNLSDGAEGNDTLVDGAEMHGGPGDDNLEGRYIPLAYGGPGNDHLRSGAGRPRLYGGDGDDVLSAYAWVEDQRATLSGEAGNDYLGGGEGADTLYGGTGDDRLDGGGSTDQLYGEDGDDRLDGNVDYSPGLPFEYDAADGGGHVNGDTCVHVAFQRNCNP